MRLGFIRWLAGLSALVAAGSAAAQSPVCRQIAGELQMLGRGGGQALQQTAGLRQQLASVSRSMSQMGCHGGGLLGQPPAQCFGLRQQAHMLSGQVQQMEAQSRQAGSDLRRRQLEDSYAVNDCAGAGRIDSVRAIYETEASRPRYATPTVPNGRGFDASAPQPAPTQDATPVRAATIAICVRTCDGFFFPINFQGADGQHNDICRASCPGSAAEMFWMPQNGNLDDAVNPRGQKYPALPAAFRYRKSYDPACSCKANGASWGQSLARAESLMRRKGDIIITAESSARLANPDQTLPLRGLRTDREMTTGSTAPAEVDKRSPDAMEAFEPLPSKR